ncbi:class II aminotransferase/8-amino-7-oxononanoate synthase [Patellaria atrata CBS 101060]|uniref:Class II aminotransferase/8-amino-7-oxononanoate synthase n=1 Tax=Patellaria atrata CBS 101060 TaxID=1346257 RepID=A0A9P4SIF3_9PEZI|nr:class II aminotransferase/8-amino-7-oxononanoate synthase [Patellaria atrata CBS 101060]
MSAFEMFHDMIVAQKPKARTLKNGPTFYRNLERRLDNRRKKDRLYVLKTPRNVVDFSSNDVLSLSTSGLLRMAFYEELAKYPKFVVGSCGSRLLDGNNTYINNLEKEIAQFHNATDGVIFSSGYDANVSLFEVFPGPKDAIVYDELVHASIHDGMRNTKATIRRSFSHNNVDSFRAVLQELHDSEEVFRSGERTVIVSTESIYSMDGTIAPLTEMVRVADEVFPTRNVEFIVDEAHSTGMLGKNGRGLVCALGLEDRIAIRLHTCGKGLGCNGATVVGNETIRTMLINYAHGLIYTTAPSFPTLAAIRAAYTLIRSDFCEERRLRLQTLVRHFYRKMFDHPSFTIAKEAGILDLPSGLNFEGKEFVSQIVPVWTRNEDNHQLAANMQYADYNAWPIDFPVVPRDQGRVRLVFHTDNTIDEIDGLVEIIIQWAEEKMEYMKDRTHWKRQLILKEKL